MLIIGTKEQRYRPHQFVMLTVVGNRVSKVIAAATSAIRVSRNAYKWLMAKTKTVLYLVKHGGYAHRYAPTVSACSPVMEAKSVPRIVMATDALRPATTVTITANNNVSLEAAR